MQTRHLATRLEDPQTEALTDKTWPLRGGSRSTVAISGESRKNYCNYSARRLKLLITSVIGGAEAAYKLLLCGNVGPKTLMTSLHKRTFGPDTFATGEDPARHNRTLTNTFGTFTDVLLAECVCL